MPCGLNSDWLSTAELCGHNIGRSVPQSSACGLFAVRRAARSRYFPVGTRRSSEGVPSETEKTQNLLSDCSKAETAESKLRFN
jgi:hypothetical protein